MLQKKNDELREAKAQRWRALAVFSDDREGLLLLGNTFAQVVENYDNPFLTYFDEEEQEEVKTILLQNFKGAPDRGYWVTHKTLPIPQAEEMKIAIKKVVAV